MKTTMYGLAVLAAVGAIAFGLFLFKYKAINMPRQADSGEITASSSEPFSVPAGFRMSLFADNVSGARVMAFDTKGVLLVSRPSEGTISALPNKDMDGKADGVFTVASGLNAPHGLAFRCSEGSPENGCELYVAESDALSVFDYDAEKIEAVNKRKLLPLPAGGQHVTRTLLFLPYPNDNILLISVGSSCNVCRQSDERRASVISYDIRTGKSEQFAKGLRNSVFMELNPVDGAVWATEMGRDGLGDEIPPDEINILAKGKNYGWPICYGKNIHDSDFDKNTYIRNPCMEPFETPSHIDIPAHSAPLGLAFIPEEGWPEGERYDLLVAYHGSWNRSTPTGYKIIRMKLDAKGNYSGTEDFITGWLREDGTRIGRPVDIKVFPGGTIFISDDGAGRVYTVTINN